jgi:hypothetical protein
MFNIHCCCCFLLVIHVILMNTEQANSMLIKRPLILVPGFGASILEAYSNNNNSTSEGIHLWEAMTDGEEKLINFLMMKYCPIDDDCEIPESTNNEYHVKAPIEKEFGLYGIASLHPFGKPYRQYFFELIQFLQSDLGYEPGKNLFAFPYDWRLNTDILSGRFEKYIDFVRNVTNSESVDIISHSFGGILVKDTILNRPIVSTKIHTLITIASPWKGNGMQFIAWTLFGSTFGNRILNPPTVRSMLLASLSIYQLLSHSYYTPLTNIGGVTPLFTYNINGQEKILNVKEAIDLMSDIFKDYSFISNGAVYQLPFNHERVMKAQNAVKLFMEDESFLHQIQPRYVFNIVGTMIDTPQSVKVTESVTDVTQLKNAQFVLQDIVSGDQLISYESAKNSGFDTLKTTVGPYTHNGILKEEVAFEAIREYLGFSCSFEGNWTLTMPDSITLAQSKYIIRIKEGFNSLVSTEFMEMSGTKQSNTWNGEGKDTYGIFKFEMTVSSDCSNMTGIITYPWTAQTSISAMRNQGTECTTVASCPVSNGSGERECIFGSLSSKCTVIKCHHNYNVTVGQPYRQSKCIWSPKFQYQPWLRPVNIVIIVVGLVVVVGAIVLFITLVSLKIGQFTVNKSQSVAIENDDSYARVVDSPDFDD